METKLGKSLDERGTVIYCLGFLERVIYTNVANNVWLARTLPFSGPIKEMSTERVFANVERLKEEGFEIKVRRN